MKDAVFTGRDLEEALEAAQRGLGVPREALRYVVLEEGGADSPARVAVLLDAMRPAAPAAAPSPPRPPRDAQERIRRWFECLGEASGAALEVRLEATEEHLAVHVSDPDGFFDPEEPAPARALEHLLQRAFGAELSPQRLSLELPGLSENREGRLRERALGLARSVLEDGVDRDTGPLNSYERRLVHMAVAEVGGLETFSSGEDPDRTVTIRRRSQ